MKYNHLPLLLGTGIYRFLVKLLVLGLLLGCAHLVRAAQYYYVDWTSADVAAGTASGIITLPDASKVTVDFKAIYADGSPGNLAFAQTNGEGTNYWIPSAPYISTQVSNAPPDSDIIALEGGQNQIYIVTFSVAIKDPIMAIVSLGEVGSNTTYDFDSPFTIVSQGVGWWGGGPNALDQLPGNILRGNEGHGTIQFIGTFSTFSWVVPTPEYWHGFTFGIRRGASQVATSGGASFSILNNVSGTVAYATGLNSAGQLGAGPLTETSAARPQAFVGRRVYPVRVYWRARRSSRSPAAVTPLAATDTPNFIAIASATAHTVALRDDGTVWAWGDNANGQLGNGATTAADEPTAVLSDGSGTPLSGVIAIAAGRDHSVAVKEDGTVWTWGSNPYGQLGDNSADTTTRLYPVPVLAGVTPLTGVRQVAASDVHTVALKADGTVWAWGSNAGGSLGTGGDPTAQRTAVQVSGLTAVQAILARGTDQSARTLAQRSDGLWGWGDNRNCQLGDTTAALGDEVLTPAPLTNLSNLGVGLNALAQGDYHGLARKADGTVWGWGGNAHGQVGDGSTTTQCAPIQVAGLSNVETIGAGVDHSLVTLRDGTVFGWGNNDQGQLGVGDTTSRLIPTPMRGEDGAGVLDLKPAAATYPLTATTAGTGSGTVSGGGDYAVGATVTLTATPIAGSTFAGWIPSPCAASFVMPASALICTAIFATGAALPGDVNGDGKVNALDVVATINAVLGIQPLPAADVNGDDAINALDVVAVINAVLGFPL